MSVHEDLLNNGENNCSFTEDEVDIMCSKDGDDACGDGVSAGEKRYKEYFDYAGINNNEKVMGYVQRFKERCI